MTLVPFEEIAREIGVSPRDAERIYNKAVNKIRWYLVKHPEQSAGLAIFLEGSRKYVPNLKIPEESEHEPDS